MGDHRLHGAGRPILPPARPNERYRAADFNKLLAQVGVNSQLHLSQPPRFFQVRHAITKQDAAVAYPVEGDTPNTYPVKWVLLEYPAVQGNVSRTVLYLDGGTVTPTSSGKDALVHNVHPDNSYIPENSIVECYFAQGVWFTDWGGGGGGTTGRKMIDFSLAAALTTTDAEVSGTIVVEYGPGEAAPASGVTLINPMNKAFFGEIDDRGLALWDSANKYVIFQLVQDCTPPA